MEKINPHAKGCFWHDLTEQVGAPHVKYCEKTICSIFSEPANTWSNLAFVFIGILIFKQIKKSLLKTYSFLVIFLGFCSFFFHMSNNYATQIVDYIGMFTLLFWVVSFNLRFLGVSVLISRVIYWGSILSCLALMEIMYRADINYQSIILVPVFCILLTEMKIKKVSTKYSLTSLFKVLPFFVGGYLCLFLDKKRIWCDEDNHLIQGHAFWHLLCAVGFYFLYQHIKNRDLKEGT